MKLICQCSDSHDDNLFGLLILDQDGAKELLKYRALWQSVRDQTDISFFKLSFWDYRIDYGRRVRTASLDISEQVKFGEWFVADDSMKIDRDVHQDAALLNIKEDGVLWTGHHKHSSGGFETETVPWKIVEDIAAGHDYAVDLDPEEGDEIPVESATPSS
jgi:hypothetical protein